MIYLKNIVSKYFCLCCLCLVSHSVSAWVEQGHEAIAGWAYADLSPEHKTYYLALAQSLPLGKKQVSEDDDRQFSYLSTFADDYRRDTLKEIFNRFSSDVPQALKDLEKKKTSSWHYHNAHVKNGSNAFCDFKNRGQLLPIIERLDKVLKSQLTQKQEAILLGFQIHLIQDLHQPLHNFTFIDRACKSDLGGNRTCVKQGKKRCEMNLHRLWDIGFGIFSERHEKPEPLVNYTFSPYQWSQESVQFFDFIYRWEHENYRAEARRITKQQVTLARQRLRHYLVEHYKQKH